MKPAALKLAAKKILRESSAPATELYLLLKVAAKELRKTRTHLRVANAALASKEQELLALRLRLKNEAHWKAL